MDNSEASADKKKCTCKTTHWKNIKAFADNADATKVVAYKHECTACAKTCLLDKNVKPTELIVKLIQMPFLVMMLP